jgi:tetratricopeptide (TPR) repeat protein
MCTLHLTELYMDGVRLQGERRYTEAIVCYERAMQTFEEHVGAHFNAALLYERENNFDKARQLYAHCATLAKNNASYKTMYQKLAAFAGAT